MADHQQRGSLKPLTVLLVDASPSDVHLTIDTLKSVGLGIGVDVVDSRAEVVGYLRTHQAMPDVILFGLNPFVVDNQQLLRELKSQRSSASIPLIVLSGSPAELEYLRSAGLGVDGFLHKPLNGEEFLSTIQDLLTPTRVTTLKRY